VNLAELSTIITIFGCPLAAGMSAASEKTGWLTVVYVGCGATIGLGAGFGVHKLAYFLLRQGRSNSWIGRTFSLAYMYLPMSTAMGAILATGCLAEWLARRI